MDITVQTKAPRFFVVSSAFLVSAILLKKILKCLLGVAPPSTPYALGAARVAYPVCVDHLFPVFLYTYTQASIILQICLLYTSDAADE